MLIVPYSPYPSRELFTFIALKFFNAREIRPNDLYRKKEINMKITLLIRNQVKDGKENKCKYIYIYMLKLSIIDKRLLYKIVCGNDDYGKKLN